MHGKHSLKLSTLYQGNYFSSINLFTFGSWLEGSNYKYVLNNLIESFQSVPEGY